MKMRQRRRDAKSQSELEKIIKKNCIEGCYFYRSQTYPKSSKRYLEQAEWTSG